MIALFFGPQGVDKSSSPTAVGETTRLSRQSEIVASQKTAQLLQLGVTMHVITTMTVYAILSAIHNLLHELDSVLTQQRQGFASAAGESEGATLQEV